MVKHEELLMMVAVSGGDHTLTAYESARKPDGTYVIPDGAAVYPIVTDSVLDPEWEVLLAGVPVMYQTINHTVGLADLLVSALLDGGAGTDTAIVQSLTKIRDTNLLALIQAREGVQAAIRAAAADANRRGGR